VLCFSVLLCLRPVVDSVRDYPFLIVTSVFSTVYCIALFYIKINNKKIMIIIIITTNDRTQRCTNRIIKIFVIFRVFQILFLGKTQHTKLKLWATLAQTRGWNEVQYTHMHEQWWATLAQTRGWKELYIYIYIYQYFVFLLTN
jgi:hypothetical protein